jgi:chaperone required for assembly of F1-ATPase
MKRFYSQVAALPVEGGFEIALDGKPVRTPGRAPLVVPTHPLGDAIADEWNAQADKIDPRSMPLTGLANAAVDRIAPDKAAFAQGLAIYGESDLLCYRAEGPGPLVCRQSELWDSILDWAGRRYDIGFEIVSGIIHRKQPAATTNRLRQAVESLSPFELAGLSPLVTVSGSLLIALAVAERAIGVGQAWDSATVDEQWQIEHWGEDEEAAKALRNRRSDFDSGARFLALLTDA